MSLLAQAAEQCRVRVRQPCRSTLSLDRWLDRRRESGGLARLSSVLRHCLVARRLLRIILPETSARQQPAGAEVAHVIRPFFCDRQLFPSLARPTLRVVRVLLVAARGQRLVITSPSPRSTATSTSSSSARPTSGSSSRLGCCARRRRSGLCAWDLAWSPSRSLDWDRRLFLLDQRWQWSASILGLQFRQLASLPRRRRRHGSSLLGRRRRELTSRSSRSAVARRLLQDGLHRRQVR